MLIRVVKMTFEPEKVEEFLDLFDKTKNKIRNFEGCEHLELMQEYHKSNIFMTYSHWKDAQSLENYRTSPLFREVWTKTKALFADKPIAFSMKKITTVKPA